MGVLSVKMRYFNTVWCGWRSGTEAGGLCGSKTTWGYTVQLLKNKMLKPRMNLKSKEFLREPQLYSGKINGTFCGHCALF